MKVLLINPAAPNIARISTGGFDLPIGSVGRFPPLGLMSIATYVKDSSEHDIDLFDCDATGMSEENIIDKIRLNSYDLVGITSFTYTFYDVLMLSRKIKSNFPEITIVIGGPHTLLFPEEILTHKEIDYIVIGEGEHVFLYLLNVLDKNETPEKTDGLGFRLDGDTTFIGAPAWIEDLDTLPFPDYNFVLSENYHSTFGTSGRTITMNTSRGCPFQCTFCQVLVKNYRAHSIDYIIKHIRHFYEKGDRNFYFFDDLFNINEKRTLDFTSAVKKSGMKIHWIFRGRAPSLTEEVCKRAAETGCEQILLGVEDYCDENLKEIKKNIKIEDVRNAIKNASLNKIKTSTNWILGLPTQKTEKDIEELINVAISTNADYALFTILQLLPGCEMYDKAVEEHVLSKDSWRNFVLNPVPSYNIDFYDKYLSPETLTKYYAEAYKRFYRRPAYILKRIVQIKSFKQLFKQIPVALHILFERKKEI